MLREYIRLLIEDAVRVNELKNVALYYGPNNEYILYNSSEADRVIDELLTDVHNGEISIDMHYKTLRERFSDANLILGTLAFKHVPGRYYDAAIVKTAAAKKGFGPFLYDLVMANEGGLVADRSAVSDRAKNVWNYYFHKRPDVEHKLLDDMEHPKTPPEIDDGIVYVSTDFVDGEGWKENTKETLENPLNYAYFLKNAPDVKALEKEHNTLEEFMKKISNQLHVGEINYGKIIRIAAARFFDANNI